MAESPDQLEKGENQKHPIVQKEKKERVKKQQ